MTYRKFASLGLVLLVVGSLTGMSVATQFAPNSHSQATGVTALPADSGTDAVQQGGGVNLSEVDVTAVEAVELAQNETGGKGVFVRLTSQNGTPVFNVTVIHENLSVTQVTVDATEGTVTDVRRNFTVVESRFLGGEAFDFGELRTVAEAIRLVQNETNGTVVNAGIRRGELVYGVALRTPEGVQTQALVTATAEPVLGIRTASPPQTTATNSS